MPESPEKPDTTAETPPEKPPAESKEPSAQAVDNQKPGTPFELAVLALQNTNSISRNGSSARSGPTAFRCGGGSCTFDSRETDCLHHCPA